MPAIRFRNADGKGAEVTVEVAPGTNRDAVRLVKTGETSVSFGC